jgi:glutathione S-transferase
MIKLYGLEISNYQAAVKAFMLEKGFQFEEVEIAPSYSEPYIELSPMGKMPFSRELCSGSANDSGRSLYQRQDV